MLDEPDYLSFKKDNPFMSTSWVFVRVKVDNITTTSELTGISTQTHYFWKKKINSINNMNSMGESQSIFGNG